MHVDAGPADAADAEPASASDRHLIRQLQDRLQECEETLGAIRRGEVDAVVVGDAQTVHRVYTLEGADKPYRLLIEQMQEGAVTLGGDGVIFYCNRRLAELVDRPQELVTGQRLQSFLMADDVRAFEELLGAACRGPARGEFTLRNPRGDETPVYVSLSLLQRGESEPLLCGVLGDLTQQKLHLRELSEANVRLLAESMQREASEEALRQSQKMEAVGQLTGGLAHDFNNLLTGITGSLEFIERRVSQGRYGDLGRYIGAARTSANRAAALTHRLLAFSRRQTLDPKLVEANRLVTGMEELLRRTVGPMIAIGMVLPNTVGAILCDAHQLENALLNLAINARDSMLQGGKMTIETAIVELDPTHAAQQDMHPGAYVTISVTDTGSGMTPEVMARAFEPFFTTKPLGEGTGLGLSMIYGFAKQSGGQARILSKPGIGTTVCVSLPSHPSLDAVVAKPAKPTVLPRALPGKTILVVEDEPVIRMLVVEVLTDLGYAVIDAVDGRAGLRHVEAAGRIDLLLTDVGLPNGMNGCQLADAARVCRPGLKVLFITGFSESAALRDGNIEEGMSVMTKPFTMQALVFKIRAMISDEC